MRIWLARHVQSALASLGRLWRQPLGTLLTVLVIGIALALPATLGVLVRNGEAVAGRWTSVRDFSVYLQPGLPVEQAGELAASLERRPLIAAVRLITADDALAELRTAGGFAGVIDALERNPLPHTLVVRPAADADDAAIAALADELRALPAVELVQLDSDWVARLDAMLAFARRAIWIAAALLVTAVIVIVGNTIRLDIQNQRAEIEVAKLLGATDAFVRRPFLYTGLWYGLAGGGVALLLLLAEQALLAGPAARLAALYGGSFEPLGLSRGGVAAVLGAALAAGLAGAWLAVARHLAAIQPRV
ncbi:MAG: ABC transporter permease [Gammaproteobacteria bacterium]|nr:MAG: ABC transporter permease [Gammaproteobacteria bacterium]